MDSVETGYDAVELARRWERITAAMPSVRDVEENGGMSKNGHATVQHDYIAEIWAFNERIAAGVELMVRELDLIVETVLETRGMVERLEARAEAESAGFATLQAALSRPSPVAPANGELSYQDRLIEEQKRKKAKDAEAG